MTTWRSATRHPVPFPLHTDPNTEAVGLAQNASAFKHRAAESRSVRARACMRTQGSPAHTGRVRVRAASARASCAHQVAQLVALIDREREADVAALGAFVVANANDGDTPLLEARKLEVK